MQIDENDYQWIFLKKFSALNISIPMSSMRKWIWKLKYNQQRHLPISKWILQNSQADGAGQSVEK